MSSSIIPSSNRSVLTSKSIFEIDDKDLDVDSDNDEDILNLLANKAENKTCNSNQTIKLDDDPSKVGENSDVFKVPATANKFGSQTNENTIKGIEMTNTSLNELFDNLKEDEEDELIKSQVDFLSSTQINSNKKETPAFPLVEKEKNEVIKKYYSQYFSSTINNSGCKF